MMVFTALVVTHHAIDRYRERVDPDASREDIREAVRTGQHIDREVVAAVTQCSRRAVATDTAYVADAGATGLFVVRREASDVVITFLALSPAQRSILWPDSAEPESPARLVG